MKLRNKSFICLITCTIILLSACNQSGIMTEEKTEVVTPVTITPVGFKSVASTFQLPAITYYLNKSVVRANTTGTLEKVTVKQGDYITAGQLMFTIRTRESEALKNAKNIDSSLAFRGVIDIYTQIEGVIYSVSHQNGDFVQDGDELAVISDQKSLVFILDVPFELDKYVEKNKRCKIILADNREIEGTINGKFSEMNMETQTLRYIIKPSSPGRLPSNLIGSVNMIKSVNENAIVLPKQAVLGDETQTEFWVMKLIDDSTAVKIMINKGFENNNEVEIVSPRFLDTDRIIMTGNYGLPDTAKISIIKE